MEPRLPNGERFIWDLPRHERGPSPEWDAWRVLDRRYERRPRKPVGPIKRLLPLLWLVALAAAAVLAFKTA